MDLQKEAGELVRKNTWVRIGLKEILEKFAIATRGLEKDGEIYAGVGIVEGMRVYIAAGWDDIVIQTGPGKFDYLYRKRYAADELEMGEVRKIVRKLPEAFKEVEKKIREKINENIELIKILGIKEE